MSFVNPHYQTPLPLDDLPDGWIDENDFLVLNLPAVHPTREHLKEARREVYPYPLWLYYVPFVGRRYMECFGKDVSADRAGLRLYHFMKKHVPGFLEAQHYKEVAKVKSVRLVFEDQGEIIFHGFAGWPTEKDSARLIVLDSQGNRSVLLYHSSFAENAVCYPEHRVLTHSAYELPLKKTAEILVSVFATIAAILSEPEEQEARDKAILREKISVAW